MCKINIAGLPKTAVLQSLFKHARPQGMGYLHYDPKDMTTEEATEVIRSFTGTCCGKTECYFDYLQGRVMKIDIASDELDPRLYDEDNGPGACASARRGLSSGSDNLAAPIA